MPIPFALSTRHIILPLRVFLQFIVSSDFPLALLYLFVSGMRVFESHVTMSIIARKLWGLYRADHGSHVHQDDGRTERCDVLLPEAGTPERLIAGIGAGLTIGIDGEDCACRMGGLEVYAGDFVGVWLGE